MVIAHLTSDPEYGDGRMPPTEEARLRLFDIVAEAMKARMCAEWSRLFEEADVPFARVGTTDEAMDDPQIRHNEMVCQVDGPLLGRTSMAGLPIKPSRTPGFAGRPRHQHRGGAAGRAPAHGIVDTGRVQFSSERLRGDAPRRDHRPRGRERDGGAPVGQAAGEPATRMIRATTTGLPAESSVARDLSWMMKTVPLHS